MNDCDAPESQARSPRSMGLTMGSDIFFNARGDGFFRKQFHPPWLIRLSLGTTATALRVKRATMTA
jgi:hypothetical protein